MLCRIRQFSEYKHTPILAPLRLIRRIHGEKPIVFVLLTDDLFFDQLLKRRDPNFSSVFIDAEYQGRRRGVLLPRLLP